MAEVLLTIFDCEKSFYKNSCQINTVKYMVKVFLLALDVLQQSNQIRLICGDN